MKKSGFSLVELVLSIVIIAIALMTVPLMLGQSAKSNQYSLMQESILASRTKMGNILSFKWDDNLSDGGLYDVYRVIDVQSGDSELARSVVSGREDRRKGHILEDKRRRMLDVDRNATEIGQESVDFNDIDDFDGNVSTVAAIGVNGATGVRGEYDYLDESLQLSTTVRFINDDTNYSKQTITFDFNATASQATTAASTSSNIKMITIETNSTSNDVPFIFRTFSSNIGQTRLYESVK